MIRFRTSRTFSTKSNITMTLIEEIRLHPSRAFKTLVLCFSMFTIALTYSVIGPTLLDLKTQVSRGLEEVSIALPARAGGYAIGSLISEYRACSKLEQIIIHVPLIFENSRYCIRESKLLPIWSHFGWILFSSNSFHPSHS
jgi:hypothetical protein